MTDRTRRAATAQLLTRRGFLALGAASAGLLAAGCATAKKQDAPDASAKLKIVASFYPMYDFAQKVAGERAEVSCLVPAGTEPHDWEPTTADISSLADADLLVWNGAGMEHWVADALAGLGDAAPATCEASSGLALLKLSAEALAEEQKEAGSEDISDTDPHCWLSPAIAQGELANIRDALSGVDADGKDVYEKNCSQWTEELGKLDEEYRTALDPLPRRAIVVSHEAFGYICHDYGLTQVPIEGIDADAEPDAQTMAEIVDFVEANNVRTIFSEELVSPKVAQAIADAAGTSLETLDPLEGLSDEDLAAGKDYFSVMRENLEKLSRALA